MTHSLFGEYLDIHSGGIDLKFPHHTNEIAQCEAYSCRICPGGEQGDGRGTDSEDGSRPWVKHWIHTGHLHIEGRKMSKSLKNFITVREYLNAHPGGGEEAAEDFRMFCLMHKYSARWVSTSHGGQFSTPPPPSKPPCSLNLRCCPCHHQNPTRPNRLSWGAVQEILWSVHFFSVSRLWVGAIQSSGREHGDYLLSPRLLGSKVWTLDCSSSNPGNG